MTLPFPLAGPALPTLLRASTGATPPQAPLGLHLVLSPDGTITGQTVWPIHAGDTFAVQLDATLFPTAVGASATLTLALPAGPAFVPATMAPRPEVSQAPPGPGGYPAAGYPGQTPAASLVFRVPGRVTRDCPPGWLPAAVRLLLAESASAIVRDLVFYVAPALDRPWSFQRGLAATLTLALTNADGSALDLTGQALVWTLGPLTKTLAAGQVVVDDPTSGVLLVPLGTSDTRQLAAGPDTWLLVDQATSRTTARGTLLVV